MQFDQVVIKNAGRLCGILQLMGIHNTFVGTELAVGEHVQVAVDAFFLQTGDQIVQPVHALRIQLRAGDPLALGEGKDVGCMPFRIQLVESYQIQAEFCQPTGQLLRIVMFGETTPTIEVGAPKLCLGAILKDKVPPLDFQEAMFAGGFFICKNTMI